MTSKILASATLITGLVTAILTLLTAFGVTITPDQHTAIQGVVAGVLVVAGAWFHPDVPIGDAAPK